MLLETLDLGIMADVGSATETGKGNRAARFLSCALLLRLLLFYFFCRFGCPCRSRKCCEPRPRNQGSLDGIDRYRTSFSSSSLTGSGLIASSASSLQRKSSISTSDSCCAEKPPLTIEHRIGLRRLRETMCSCSSLRYFPDPSAHFLVSGCCTGLQKRHFQAKLWST